MFDKTILKDFTKTIGFLLFKKVFFGYILFVLLFTFYEIYSQYSFSKKIVLKDLVNTEKSFHDVLALNIWHFDEESIKSNVNAIINDKTITGVSIITPSEEVLILKGTVSFDEKKFNDFIFEKNEDEIIYKKKLITHTFNLIDNKNSPDEVLGTITFYTEESTIFALAKEGIYLTIINAIATTIVLWILFIYFANKILTIPLRELTKATKELKVKDYNIIEISLDTEEKHELTVLADTFNEMSRRINETYVNLKQLNIIQDIQKKKLVDANKHKDDFLANMSHELKTPLNSINVISSIMMKNTNKSLDDKQVKNLSIINNCGNDLLYLINDVLDLSKLEAGEIKLDYSSIDFYPLILSIKEMFEPQVLQKNVDFIFECDQDIGLIYSDTQRIKQIVKNLLSNALKFVSDGSISLLVINEEKDISIIVKDTGIGIEQAKLEHIFDRFKQADSSTTRKYGGTGLGLAICKELLDLLEGEIIVNSEVNKGTIFTIRFPKNKDKVSNEDIIKEKVILSSSSQTKKKSFETSINKEETQDTNKQDIKANILILNNDPMSFFATTVELKKNFNIKQTTTFDDLKSLIQKNEYFLYIIDITNQNLEEIENFLDNTSTHCVIVYKEHISTKLTDKASFIYQKPLNKDAFISEINELKAKT